MCLKKHARFKYLGVWPAQHRTQTAQKFTIWCMVLPFIIQNVKQICSSFFLALGAAYGTAKSGTGIAAMSVMRPELIMKSIIPVVMAGIIAIYWLVVAVLIANNISDRVTLYK